MDHLLTLLRAAAEDTRLRILALAAREDLTVSDYVHVLGQSQPRVSRHLKLLADAGLIRRYAEGAWAYYGLAPAGEGGDLARWLIDRLDPSDAAYRGDRTRQAEIRAVQQAEAAAYFAKVAESWDLLKTLHVPEAAVEAAVLGALSGRQVDLVIDLGTGTGRMLEVLAPAYKRGIGLDSSREMLAVARSRLASSGLAHAQVRLADIADLDADIGLGDVIVIHQVLHYFDDPGRMLAQARTLLRPGGEILIVDFAPHDLEFLRADHAHRRLGLSQEQMQGWAEAAGLVVRSSREFPSDNQDRGLTVCLWHLGDRTNTDKA